MHFFRAREAADSWREGRTGVAVLTIDDGFALARARWVDLHRAAARRPAGQSPAAG
jgi:hypothetical protein